MFETKLPFQFLARQNPARAFLLDFEHYLNLDLISHYQVVGWTNESVEYFSYFSSLLVIFAEALTKFVCECIYAYK